MVKLLHYHCPDVLVPAQYKPRTCSRVMPQGQCHVSKQRISVNRRVRQAGRLSERKTGRDKRDAGRNMERWAAVKRQKERRESYWATQCNAADACTVPYHSSQSDVILEEGSQGHQQGDDVLRQAERILLISIQEGGQSTIRCKSH